MRVTIENSGTSHALEGVVLTLLVRKIGKRFEVNTAYADTANPKTVAEATAAMYMVLGQALDSAGVNEVCVAKTGARRKV